MQYIHDTNFYRKLATEYSYDDAKKLILNWKRENTNDKAIFSNIVATELISHLLDKNKTREICYKSLQLMFIHCSEFSEGKIKGTIVPTFYELLTRYFYYKESSFKVFNSNIFSIASNIAKSDTIEFTTNYKEEISQVIEFRKQEIDSIVDNFERYIKSFNDEGIADWYIFQTNTTLKKEFESYMKKGQFNQIIGLLLFKLATSESKSEITDDATSKYKESFNHEFSTSIKFFTDNILNKLTQIKKMEYFYHPATDPKKRWNSFYDMQIIFATEYENSFKRPTILITSEEKINCCFNEDKKGSFCIKTDTYLKNYS